METTNFTNARKNLSSILDRVADNASYTIITRRNKPDSVVMSWDSFRGMMETMHLLSSPANAKHLEESIAQYRAGHFAEKPLIHPHNVQASSSQKVT